MGQWPFHRRLCLRAIASVRGPAAEMYSLCFFRTFSWNRKSCGSVLFCVLGVSRGGGFQAVCVVSCWNCQEHIVILKGFLHIPICNFCKLSKYQYFLHSWKQRMFWRRHRQWRRQSTNGSEIARRYHYFNPQKVAKTRRPLIWPSLPFHLRVDLKIILSLLAPETCLRNMRFVAFRTYLLFFYNIAVLLFAGNGETTGLIRIVHEH